MKLTRDSLFNEGKKLLGADGLNGIRWPDEAVQRNYTGSSGENLLIRTLDFIDKLAYAAPIIHEKNWLGLDYGVGFGRIASVLSLFGSPEQLVCVDAWEKSIKIARESGLQNKLRLVPSLLQDDSIPDASYDFAYAYSIFTHLSEQIFTTNIERIMFSLKPGGVFVFTVRDSIFLEFLKRNNKFHSIEDRYTADGYWFGNAQNQHYGDTVVSRSWIDARLLCFGEIADHGVCASEPYQRIMSITKPL